MSCPKPLLSLCAVPKAANRDGLAIPNAYLNLPFYDGLVFADGRVLTFPNETTAQNKAKTLAGTLKPNVFKKDCCSCSC